MTMKNSVKRAIMLATLSATLILGGCAGTQEINQQSAVSYSRAVTELKAKGEVDTTSRTAKRIYAVFNRMKPYAQKANKTGTPFDWQLTVMKNDQLNAWAMPGGKMMFYTGLVNRLKLTNDEIAVVMGHEMAHALEEHGKQKVNFQTATGILGQIGSIAIAATTGYDMTSVVSLTEEFALNRPFSRSNESEADKVGLMLSAEAGYNPQAALNVWKKMSQASGGSGGIVESLTSTHPTDAERMSALEKLMPQAMKIYNASRKK